MEWCSGAQKDLLVGVCRESIHLEGVAGEMGAPDGAVGVKPGLWGYGVQGRWGCRRGL